MTDRLDELLKISAAISRGEVPLYQHNECFTAGAFDLLLINAHGPEAFDLLEGLCDRYASVQASGALAGYFELLAQLARQSDTTEMPRGLEAIMATHPGLARELGTWYRSAG